MGLPLPWGFEVNIVYRSYQKSPRRKRGGGGGAGVKLTKPQTQFWLVTFFIVHSQIPAGFSPCPLYPSQGPLLGLYQHLPTVSLSGTFACFLSLLAHLFDSTHCIHRRDLNEGHHQFDNTTFMTATFCDYCGKKVSCGLWFTSPFP